VLRGFFERKVAFFGLGKGDLELFLASEAEV